MKLFALCFLPRKRLCIKAMGWKEECNFPQPRGALIPEKTLMQFYHQTRTCESLARMRAERKTVFHVHVQTNTNLKQSEGNGRLKEFTTCCQNWLIHNGNVVRVVLREVWKEPETINQSPGLILHQCLYCICRQHVCISSRLWHLGTDSKSCRYLKFPSNLPIFCFSFTVKPLHSAQLSHLLMRICLHNIKDDLVIFR